MEDLTDRGDLTGRGDLTARRDLTPWGDLTARLTVSGLSNQYGSRFDKCHLLTGVNLGMVSHPKIPSKIMISEKNNVCIKEKGFIWPLCHNLQKLSTKPTTKTEKSFLDRGLIRLQTHPDPTQNFSL